MLAWSLNLAYLAVLTLLSPYLLWRSWRTGRYRRGWAMKLWGAFPPTASRMSPDKPRQRVIWLHAVSVGEVNLLETIIQRLEAAMPNCHCVISTTTDTGYALAAKKYAPRPVFYCPLDFSWAVRRAMRRVRPDLLVLAELELWPNLIAAAHRSGAKVAVVNGRLSAQSFRGYRRIRWLVSKVLRKMDWVAVQSEVYAQRFIELGMPADRVTVTGSVKFDGACADRNNEQTTTLVDWAGYSANDFVFVAGSTQAPEEELALRAYLNLRDKHPRLRLVLVPRHPERREEVVQVLKSANVEYTCRSEPAIDGVGDRVLLVDVVGELGAWWGRADAAFVGGSMGTRGGQNMIEPAAYGCPVSFGPQTRNFRDVVQLMMARDAAVVVADGDQMQAFVERCLGEHEWASSLGSRAAELVRQQQGAADQTARGIEALLDAAPSLRKRAA